MRKVAIAVISVLIFSTSVLAQTESVICPSISVDGPEMSVPAGVPVTFTAVVINTEKYNIKYEWSVDEGEIIEGQGTAKIKVRTGVEPTRATVAIIGLPSGCEYTASDTTVSYCSIPPVLLDEYSIKNNQIDKERLDLFLNELQNDPGVTGMIVETFKKNTDRKSIEQKKFETLNYLQEKLLSKSDRIVLKICEGDADSTRLWRIPLGAEHPELENCEP